MAGKLPTLSLYELQIIDEHLDRLIAASMKQIQAYRPPKGEKASEWQINVYQYWRHCNAALRWAKKTAAQRVERIPNGR